MKLARYCSISSVIPTHAVFLKNHCRLSSPSYNGNLTGLRRISTYCQKHKLNAKSEMVVEKYPPPWFRSVFRYSNLISLQNKFSYCINAH